MPYRHFNQEIKKLGSCLYRFLERELSLRPMNSCLRTCDPWPHSKSNFRRTSGNGETHRWWLRSGICTRHLASRRNFQSSFPPRHSQSPADCASTMTVLRMNITLTWGKVKFFVCVHAQPCCSLTWASGRNALAIVRPRSSSFADG
jgi:hypothetical protein